MLACYTGSIRIKGRIRAVCSYDFFKGPAFIAVIRVVAGDIANIYHWNCYEPCVPNVTAWAEPCRPGP